jgi:putative transposase
LWREKRKVRKDGRIELQGNTYRVDSQFVSRQIELRFDPFDLSLLEVWLEGICFGTANVVQQGREKHIAVERLTPPGSQPAAPAQPKTSLDYLALLRAEYQQQQRQQAGTLRFTQFPPETK